MFHHFTGFVEVNWNRGAVTGKLNKQFPEKLPEKQGQFSLRFPIIIPDTKSAFFGDFRPSVSHLRSIGVIRTRVLNARIHRGCIPAHLTTTVTNSPALKFGHTGTGWINRRIRLRMAANRSHEIETSAIWKHV